MKINGNTKISAIINHDKRAIEAIASISSHFEKLKNPILRKILAPRVTLADAARIGKCSVNDFFEVLSELGFDIEQVSTEKKDSKVEGSPNIDKAFEENRVQTLDVRPILESGIDPFEHIQDAYQELEEGHVLEILNSFEPTPLINIMRDKGIEHSVRTEEEVVKTCFYKDKNIVKQVAGSINRISEEEMNTKIGVYGYKIREINVRHLEMPEPMVTILQEVEKLGEEQLLFVHHKKIPQYLLPELEKRNLTVYLAELGKNDVKLLIHNRWNT